MFENIKSLRPYFHSLREIESNVSLDIKLPINWKFDEIVKPYRSLKTKVQDKNEKFTLVSLISNASAEGYEVAFACANEIIMINKEEEEKKRLFHEKVKELESLFLKESLDKLKEINLLHDYGQEITTGDGMVIEGDGEGQDRDRDTEEEDD